MPHRMNALPFYRYKRIILYSIFLLGWLSSDQAVIPSALAQQNGWSEVENISQTPTASAYPCITSDKAGYVHVLWSEDIGGITQNLDFLSNGSPNLDPWGNQINRLIDLGPTLYYTRWDGSTWLEPVDVQYNSFPQGDITFPEAVVDPDGYLHTVWVSTQAEFAFLSYSQALASSAESARTWTKEVVLANNILNAYYPIDIAADHSGGLHIIYSQIGQTPGVYTINSFDGGNTWSAPINLYRTYDARGLQEGTSQVRLEVDNKNRMHASWTRYGAGGNGKAIYYAQSQDQGQTWTKPFEVAEWQPGWYEVDWLSVGVIDDEIHLIWEGNATIALIFERISKDGGETWSRPKQIFQKLRGENGFTDLVVDSSGRLNLVFTKRSSDQTHGIWYSTWETTHWADPTVLGSDNPNLYGSLDFLSDADLVSIERSLLGRAVRYQKSTIVNGNELFVVFANEWGGEILSSHTLLSTPRIEPEPYPTAVNLNVTTATPTSPYVQPAVIETSLLLDTPQQRSDTSPSRNILWGIIPVIVLLVGLVTYKSIQKNK